LPQVMLPVRRVMSRGQLVMRRVMLPLSAMDSAQ